MLGIENLKKLIDLGLRIPKEIADVTEDGKVTIGEVFGFLPVATEIIAVSKSWKDVVAEFKDLDDQEKQSLYQYFADKFDLPNDKVELFVEHALLQAITLIKLVEEFKALKQ